MNEKLNEALEDNTIIGVDNFGRESIIVLKEDYPMEPEKFHGMVPEKVEINYENIYIS